VNEPVVTLTDYGLTIECWLFAALIMKAKLDPAMDRLWIAFFGFIGAASLLGGTVHAFLPDESTTLFAIVWDANLIALGCVSVAVWMLGATLLRSDEIKTLVRIASYALFVFYVLIVVFISNRFLVAIGMYLPATVFLTVAMAMAHSREPKRGWRVGLIGLALTYAAAVVQQAKIAIHPVWFDHNALYHAIQAVALYLLFRAQRASARLGR
jgi:hypothetical protein